MATGLKVKEVERALSSMFTKAEVEALARETGFIKRVRKISAWAMLWTLVLGFAGERERSVSSLRRTWEVLTGGQVVPSSFYDRFGPGLVRFLKKLLAQAMARTQQPSRALRGLWKRFSDVVLIDATVFRLHDLLAPAFRGSGRGSCKAAGKLHMVISAVGGGPRSVRLTGETDSENRRLTVGPWVRGRLLLFDLGYYRFQLFDRIHHHGGFFISRAKRTCNPVITKLLRPVRGRAVDVCQGSGKGIALQIGQSDRSEGGCSAPPWGGWRRSAERCRSAISARVT